MSKIKYSLALNPAVIKCVDFFAETNDMSRSAAVNEILYNFCLDRYGFLESTIFNSDSNIKGQIELEGAGETYK